MSEQKYRELTATDGNIQDTDELRFDGGTRSGLAGEGAWTSARVVADGVHIGKPLSFWFQASQFYPHLIYRARRPIPDTESEEAKLIAWLEEKGGTLNNHEGHTRDVGMNGRVMVPLLSGGKRYYYGRTYLEALQKAKEAGDKSDAVTELQERNRRVWDFISSGVHCPDSNINRLVDELDKAITAETQNRK